MNVRGGGGVTMKVRGVSQNEKEVRRRRERHGQ